MNQVVEEITKGLVDQGRIMEAGWMALKLTSIPMNASEIQVQEMRKAFFAGAQHLFGSIMTMLESGSEASENDLKRMNSIDDELKEYVREMKANIRRES